MEVFYEKADMISVIASHHDEAFAEIDTHALHPRQELEQYVNLSQEYGVKIEFEIWHTGSIWNLNYIIENSKLFPTYITTLFFGWPGGTWTPPTIREYLYRKENMPEGTIQTVSVMGKEQTLLHSTAIMMGNHVRVGTEDYPYSHGGEIADTHELVSEIAQAAKCLGRQVASIEETRNLMGL